MKSPTVASKCLPFASSPISSSTTFLTQLLAWESLKLLFEQKETLASGMLNLLLSPQMFLPRNQHAMLPPFLLISLFLPKCHLSRQKIPATPSKIMPHPSWPTSSPASVLVLMFMTVWHYVYVNSSFSYTWQHPPTMFAGSLSLFISSAFVLTIA